MSRMPACLCLRLTPLCRKVPPVLRGVLGKSSFLCLIGLIEADVANLVRASLGCSSLVWDTAGEIEIGEDASGGVLP